MMTQAVISVYGGGGIVQMIRLASNMPVSAHRANRDDNKSHTNKNKVK